MPKRSKKNLDRLEGKASSKTAGADRHGRRTGAIIIAAVTITLILIFAATFYYQTQVAPFNQPVLTVDKTVIDMGYFLKRAKMVGGDPVTALQHMVDEQIIKIKAPTFGITVTPEEIDSELLYIASTGNVTGNMTDNLTGTYLTESEFKTWYRQQLDFSGLSDTEYKEMTHTNMLAAKLQQYLAERVPTVAEQIHLNVLVLANSADAAKAKARIQAGENFTSVAREVSLATPSKEKGGDIGWLPRGILSYDNITFTLGIGAVSDALAANPTTPNTSQYLLFMVSEKAAAREIDDSLIQVLKFRALSNWLIQEEPLHNIIVNYDFNNPANQAWINLQLTKINP